VELTSRPRLDFRQGGSAARAEQLLLYAAVLYGGAFAVHTGDHLRRGFSIETVEVLVLGSAASVMQVLAIAAVFARYRLAPLLAVAVGFPDAVGIAAVHLLPHWSSFSDAFPGAHATGVNAFSWVAAIVEIGGALAFGAAGLYRLRTARADAGGPPQLQGVPGS
jgi:hypothetical protein